MRHWIFKANPEKYKLAERLLDPLCLTTWKVNDEYRRHVTIGDTAFIFRTGTQRGIVGALRVISEPRHMEEIETERPYCTDLPLGLELRVLGEYTHRCPSVTTAEELRGIPALKNLSIFPENAFQQKTTFPVMAEEALILAGLLESRCKIEVLKG